ncbi:TM0106 family RecB-like putative nuclease [Gordonia liuliyuniae]|uniref:TM0106 family RecB-like putative nuclease n=1 Tax=Gordonia liuliyuniae TaxID=2911517 RepID=A0ABS9INY7_9ACTN|nr:TM0106 family RecB-like putative nuclease [Gordonia liuliyuniae]MCF8587256.1 TM0106 family RecB-like putative nuclease [Gordonia liuliyuniae]
MSSAVLGARNLSGCEHRLALDFAERGDAAASDVSPEARRRIEAAQSHRASVIATLHGFQSGQPADTIVTVDDGPHRDRVEQTRRAVESGAAWIFRAALPTDAGRGRRGHAEALIRHDGGYLPVIVVNHRVTTPTSPDRPADAPAPTLRTSPLWGWLPELDATRSFRSQRRDVLRLSHLTAMLDDLGWGVDAADRWGGLIGLDADCIVAVPLTAAMDAYAEVFARRRAVVDGQVRTGPRRVAECRSCHWWPRCEAELVERRDVSLVVGGSQSLVLQDAGIVTVDDLATHRGDPPADWPGAVSFDDAIVSARCWVDGVPLARRGDRPYVRRADVEVDVDMESYSERGAYMWGTLLTDTTDPGRDVRYRAFVTWDPLPSVDEGRSFAEFWAWLSAERAAAHAAGKTFAAYCYSQQAENRWLRGSADRFHRVVPGVPSRAEVDAFIGSKEWVDVFEAVGRNFVCPRGKGLKRIAPVAGFGWRDDEASGEASMEWYAAAVALDGAPQDLSQRDRLLVYNEDDVRATKVLREWMSSDAVLDLPSSRDLLSH